MTNVSKMRQLADWFIVTLSLDSRTKHLAVWLKDVIKSSDIFCAEQIARGIDVAIDYANIDKLLPKINMSSDDFHNKIEEIVIYADNVRNGKP